MSISVVNDKGVTVVTMVTDNDSGVPPLCQILKALCYSPMSCSVNKAMIQPTVVGTLGIVQIMVGLFNIGLGPERIETYPYWLGALFVFAGVVSVLVAMCPSRFLVVFVVFGNIVGSIFAIVGIVLYAIHLGNISIIRMCSSVADSDENCRYVAYLAQRLVRGVDITLIILAVLQLCVCISLAVLGVRAVCYRENEEDVRENEVYQPLLKEILTNNPGA
ncbi:membrane-spanning 4-domains subfamily A member 4D-like [Melanotaenia boesemani]|uniref:membrane-spanning 4-domains subfamily A member 4D-like n=1 Tax=Melanotaenia boesemani TaxID=1250792 RepID=UPI001C0431F9|nr:membrane-spanning 4-domains subfamily A member 4D-like [Melanotaenia boesemani]XP_041844273.1 membrane-spanning 4-domains subfamily A member 4D-like [Melanotaenia boesemani]